MHNINYSGGKYSFAAKGKAWHRLGVEVPSAMTTEEAIRLANMDYEVKLAELEAKIPITSIGGLGEPFADTLVQPIKSNFATYREDTNEIFSVVGSRYEVVQNRQAFQFFDDIVGSKEAIIETAGALGKGETVFITAKLPSYIKGPDGNAIEKYLLLYHTHDGTSSIQAMFTPIRVVCNNTLTAALGRGNNSNKISLRHTASVHSRLKEGAKLLSLTNDLSDAYTHYFKQMNERAVDAETLENYFTQVMSLVPQEDGNFSTKAKNILSDLLNYHEDGPGQAPIRGTAYGAYNAVTGYFNNVKEYKTAEDKMKKTILGTGQLKSQRAFDAALALTLN